MALQTTDVLDQVSKSGIVADEVIQKIHSELNQLMLGKLTQQKESNSLKEMTKMFNEEWTKFRREVDENVDTYANSSPSQKELYEGNNQDAMAEAMQTMSAFTNIPRTDAIAGMFAVPPSKISASQLHNATLDGVIGTALQHLRSYLFNHFRNYTHKNKDFEKLVKKTMYHCEWQSKFLFGCSNFLKAGNACGEKIWNWDKATKQWYIEKIVFAPTSNLQYMIDLQGNTIGAVQPNIFADPQGLFAPNNSRSRESEYALREYIGHKLPYMILPRKDLFYVSYDNVFDPYGVSPVRRAYQYFQNKQLLLSMLLNASAKNSSPYIVATFDKNTYENNYQLEQVQNELARLSVGDTAFVPAGTELDVLDVNKGSIDSLINAIEYNDKIMLNSMLATGFSTDQSSSYSGKESDKSQVIQSLDLYVATMEESINRDILCDLAVQNNYPEVYRDLDFGTWGTKELTAEYKNQYMNLITQAIDTGAMDVKNPDALKEVNENLGIPVTEGNTFEENLKIVAPLKSKSTGDNREGTFAHQNNQPFANKDKK